MSLELGCDTQEKNVDVKTIGPFEIRVGEHYIGACDFVFAVEYFLTNCDLIDDDIRVHFVERIKNIQIVRGFNPNFVRYEMPRYSDEMMNAINKYMRRKAAINNMIMNSSYETEEEEE